MKSLIDILPIGSKLTVECKDDCGCGYEYSFEFLLETKEDDEIRFVSKTVSNYEIERCYLPTDDLLYRVFEELRDELDNQDEEG